MRKIHILIIAISCHFSFAHSLPSGLVSAEVQSIVGQIASGTLTKGLGQFHSADYWWPGIKVGAEFNFFQAGQIDEMGQGNTNISSAYPSLRFVISKKWPKNIETIIQFIPADTLSIIGSAGLLLKVPVYQDPLARFNLFPFLGVTKSSGFNTTFESTAFEFGAIANKEYYQWKPYIGAGVLLMSGSVPAALMQKGSNEASSSTLHLFAGADWNCFSNFNTALQIDFMNLSPRVSLSGFLKF